MRLTQKKIESILIRFVGEEGLPLVRELIGKENISEFDLATKLKKDIKVIRKQIYLLQDQNLVSFTKKKDKQKGWYIYYWTLMPESVKFNYYKIKKELLAKLKLQIEEESNELFFICSQKCVRLNFDESMDYEFHCPECGELINQEENKNKIEDIKKKIIEIEKELKEIDKKKVKRKKVKEQKKEIKSIKKEKRKVAKKVTKKKSPVKKIKTKTSKKKPVVKKKVATKKKITKAKKIIKKKVAKRKISKKKTPTKKTIKRNVAKKGAGKQKIIVQKVNSKKSKKKIITKKKKRKKDEYF